MVRSLVSLTISRQVVSRLSEFHQMVKTGKSIWCFLEKLVMTFGNHSCPLIHSRIPIGETIPIYSCGLLCQIIPLKPLPD
jgi:hypothetical protein